MNSINSEKIIAEVSHSELIPFLRQHLKIKRIWGMVYWVFNSLFIGYALHYLLTHNLSFDEVTKSLGLGFTMFFAFLPIHEGIHGLAYKLMGAPQISFGGDWRKLIFYAVADKFVIGNRKFLFVALTPFVLINAALLILIMSFPSYTLLFSFTLIFHTAGCFGDFSLISFMHLHRNRNILTMDSVSENKTYFFEGPSLTK